MSEKTLATRLSEELDQTVLMAVGAYNARREAELLATGAKEAHLDLLDKAVNLRRAMLSMVGTLPDTTSMEALHVNRWIDSRAVHLTDDRGTAGAWPR